MPACAYSSLRGGFSEEAAEENRPCPVPALFRYRPESRAMPVAPVQALEQFEFLLAATYAAQRGNEPAALDVEASFRHDLPVMKIAGAQRLSAVPGAR